MVIHRFYVDIGKRNRNVIRAVFVRGNICLCQRVPFSAICIYYKPHVRVVGDKEATSSNMDVKEVCVRYKQVSATSRCPRLAGVRD